MPELLLELGCEELPASFVQKAFTDLAEAVASRLREAAVPFEPGHAPIGTPRRLIVHFLDLPAKQPDQQKEARGPALAAAFDASGAPTKALEGFCRGQGVEVGSVRKEGDYVWVDKVIPGKPLPELLSEILPEAIRALTFDKAMRWGQARMRFARPIRWIVALFDGQVVPFSIESVTSGNLSRGHRFYAPSEFPVKNFDNLVDELISRKVEPEPDERERRIREGIVITCSGQADVRDDLVHENVHLTEWPTVLEGQFREDYLELPEPVLITAMAKHEKMFPVRGKDGRLTNRFLFVRNSGEDETVRQGAAWVLNARFNDAKFFFDEDKKSTMDDFLAKGDRIVFQEKLGSVRQRADRLSNLAERLVLATNGSAEESAWARQAGLYAKADLGSGLVSELASLQGVVGGEYAKREGFPEAVCYAIATQYNLNANLGPDTAKERLGIFVLMADQLDKLAGYLGLGLVPSGSSDPFGLRRAASLLIEACWLLPMAVPSLREMLGWAVDAYSAHGHEFDKHAVFTTAQDIVEARYEALLSDARHDLLAAAILNDDPDQAMSPQGVRRRLGLLERISEDTALIQTATRPINIVRSAREKEIAIPESVIVEKLDSTEGVALHSLLQQIDVSLPLDAAKSLQTPINAFFDSTMIMVDDTDIRGARLALLNSVASVLRNVGDFTKIVIEGEK